MVGAVTCWFDLVVVRYRKYVYQVCDDFWVMTSSRCQRFRFTVETMHVGDRLDVIVNVKIITSVFLEQNVCWPNLERPFVYDHMCYVLIYDFYNL